MRLGLLVVHSLEVVNFGSIMQERDVVEYVIIEWDLTHLLDHDREVLD